MASVSFKANNHGNKISAKLNAMVSKAKDCRSFLLNVIEPMYLQAQVDRWHSENSSETGQWAPLNLKYQEYKKRKYASYPENGTKMMIATGKLIKAVTRNGPGYKRVATNRKLEISIDDGVVPYAKYVALKREFMSFGYPTITRMKNAITDYLLR